MATQKGTKAKREERLTKVSALLKARYSYRQMARELGVSKSQIAKDVKTLFERWREEGMRNIDRQVAMDLKTIDEAMQRLYPNLQSGDPEAIRTMLKCMERRAKLLGLDAPERREISGPGGGPIPVQDMTEEELDAVLDGYKAELAAPSGN